MSIMSSETRNPEDVINILVASDIHLGYAEKDPVRGDDSFNTFEEILQTAVSRDVDFILLGGDLFHDNKPTLKCIHRCLALLRKYCMGDKSIGVQFVSNAEENFQNCFYKSVNYEDPNLNISIPVFSIHGNHDDPSGFGSTSSMDVLSVSGLVNYFGKWTDLKQIVMSPLLMMKGSTKLAIYGLSYIKDERLSRLFRDRKVEMLRPEEYKDDWFNIFVLHQNRAARGVASYIPEEALPEFMDLIFWGHEHECRIKPEENQSQGFFVTQPGSPVATSLCEGEAVEKHIGLLKIHGKKFSLDSIKLKTVRPFVFDTIYISNSSVDVSGENPSEEVEAYVSEYVASMIDKADEQITGNSRQPPLPLIRLRVEYTDDNQVFNVMRFGNQLQSRVANPTDMILFRKERIDSKRKFGDVVLDQDALDAVLRTENPEGLWENRVEKVVERYFSEASEEKHMSILSVKGMAEAVMSYVDKDNKDAVLELVRHQISKTIEKIKSSDVNENEIEDEIERLRVRRLCREEQEADAKDARQLLENCRKTDDRENTTKIGSDSDGNNSDDYIPEEVMPVAKTRGRGGRGRAKTETNSVNGVQERGRGRGRGSRGGRGTQNVKEPKTSKTPLAIQTSIRESFSQQRSRSNIKPTRSRGVTYVDESDDSSG